MSDDLLDIPPFFLGTYQLKLDEKSRFIFPAKYRSFFQDGLIVTRGLDRCLFIYTGKEFRKIYENLRGAPVTSKQVRDYTRLLLSGAHDETPDKQGRVSIPAHLRGYANLERELVVIGAGNRLEIWDAETWTQYLSDKEQGYSDISEQILPEFDF